MIGPVSEGEVQFKVREFRLGLEVERLEITIGEVVSLWMVILPPVGMARISVASADELTLELSGSMDRVRVPGVLVGKLMVNMVLSVPFVE